MKPIVLIDLSGNFWPTFYATNSAADAYRQVLDLIDGYRQDYPRTAVCCEGKRPIRFDWFPEYKANRREKPEEASEALRAIINQASTWDIPVLSIDGYEADDVIATLARQAWMDDVHILSKDKDLAALVSENVKLITKRGLMGPAECFEKYGVSPSQIRDWIALVGDAADNVPGCPSCGPGRACDLLAKFGTLDAIRAATDEEILAVRGVGKKTLDSLRAWDPALAVKLVTLIDDAPVTIEQLWPLAA